MAKFVKARIKRENGEGTHYVYPEAWDARKIDVVVYETRYPGGQASCAARGKADEFCIGCVSDADLASFLRSADITEISKEDAVALCSEWTGEDETSEVEGRKHYGKAIDEHEADMDRRRP